MRIGFVGAGRMAEAMVAALLRSSTVRPADITASDVSPERRNAVLRTCGIRVSPDNAAVFHSSQVVFLAVKPQQLDDVLRGVAAAATPKHLVLSIAAGKRLAGLEALLPDARVVRVMPNVACLVAEAMCVFAPGSRATPADRETVTRLLACCGQVLELPEELFDAVTALSGSGPAFFAYLLDRLVDGAVAEGMTREHAMILARQTMLGTARLLRDGGQTPQALIDSVTSARGTTAEGRKILEASDVGDVLVQTIQAAARRSRELSQG